MYAEWNKGKNAHVTRRQKLAIADADKSRGK